MSNANGENVDAKDKKILKLNFKNISNREISRRLRIGAASVSRYLARAKAVGLVWPLSDEWSEEKKMALSQNLWVNN